MNLLTYMAIAREDDYEEVLTATSYVELIKKAIEHLLDMKGDDYPNVYKFIQPNSVDFIMELEDEEYRDVLNEMICYLASQGCSYTTKILEVDHEFSEEDLINISNEVL